MSPLHQLINLAKEGFSRGWDSLDQRDKLKEINDLTVQIRSAPRLVEIDLEKATRNARSNGWHSHPEIRPDGTQYLALIGGRFFCGSFTEQWFGLNFSGWHNPAGLQFDKPGTNVSSWQKLWRIEQ